MNRRLLFAKLGEWAAALGLGGFATASAPPVGGSPHRPVVRIPVHWVNFDRRHVNAWLIEYENGNGLIQYEQRPPVATSGGLVRSIQQIVTKGRCDEAWRHTTGRAPVGTWHRRERCPCGRPYSEWWYGRQRRDVERAVTPRPNERFGGFSQVRYQDASSIVKTGIDSHGSFWIGREPDRDEDFAVEAARLASFGRRVGGSLV